MSVGDTTIVVLSYNRPAMLREALASCLAQVPPARAIIVVDNPSPASGEVEAVVASFPGVRLIRPARNLGFAGGMNAGLQACTGEFVFLTEDDIVAAPDCVALLRDHLLARPTCALAGAVMMNRTAGTVRSAGCLAPLRSVFTQTVLGAGAPAPPRADPHAVDFLPGAGVLGRRTSLLLAGGFRAEFFMYGEDLELCLRLRRTGRTVDIVPAARMDHFEPPAAAEPPGLDRHKWKNLFAVYVLHARPAVWPGFVARYGVALPWRRARAGGAGLGALAGGWAWLLPRLPALLLQRARLPGRPPVTTGAAP